MPACASIVGDELTAETEPSVSLTLPCNSWPTLRRFRMPSGLATAGDLAARIAEEFSLNVRGAEELQLIMDGFAVLPGSAADVIRDGDLVKVQRAPGQRSGPRAKAHAVSKPAGGSAGTTDGAAGAPQQAAGGQQLSRKRKAAAPAQQQPRPAKKPATAATATAAPDSSSSDESSSEEDASSSDDDESSDEAATSLGKLQLRLLAGTVWPAPHCQDAKPKDDTYKLRGE